MNMSANSVVYTLSGFKRFLINPSGHVPGAAASFLKVTVFMHRTMPAILPVENAGLNLLPEEQTINQNKRIWKVLMMLMIVAQ